MTQIIPTLQIYNTNTYFSLSKLHQRISFSSTISATQNFPGDDGFILNATSHHRRCPSRKSIYGPHCKYACSLTTKGVLMCSVLELNIQAYTSRKNIIQCIYKLIKQTLSNNYHIILTPFVVRLLMILVFLNKIMLRIYFKKVNFEYGVLQYIIEDVSFVKVLHVKVPYEWKDLSTDILVLVMTFLQQIVLRFWYENFKKPILFVVYPKTVYGT